MLLASLTSDSYKMQTKSVASPTSNNSGCTLHLMDTVRILVEKGQSDPMIACSTFGSVFHAWRGPEEPFVWLLGQESFAVELKATMQLMTHESIYQSMSDSVSPRGPELLMDVLWNDESASDIVSMGQNSGFTVLHNVISSLKHRYVADGNSNHRAWLRLGEMLIRNGADIHARRSRGFFRGYTPLNIMLPAGSHPAHLRSSLKPSSISVGHTSDTRGTEETDPSWNRYRIWEDAEREAYQNKVEERRKILISWWLNCLDNAGYDLHQYARREEALYPGGIVGQASTGIRRPWNLTVSRSFQYGKASNDLTVMWQVIKVDNEDFDAGSQHPRMPGSWPSR